MLSKRNIFDIFCGYSKGKRSVKWNLRKSWEVLKLAQNFQKIKVVTGKTPFLVIGPVYGHYCWLQNETSEKKAFQY